MERSKSLIINKFEKLSDQDKKELQDFISGITTEWRIRALPDEFIIPKDCAVCGIAILNMAQLGREIDGEYICRRCEYA